MVISERYLYVYGDKDDLEPKHKINLAKTRVGVDGSFDAENVVKINHRGYNLIMSLGSKSEFDEMLKKIEMIKNEKIDKDLLEELEEE